MSKTLLLISQLPQDRLFAENVAVTAGLSLRICANALEGAAFIVSSEPAVIFADTSTEGLYQELENAIQQSIGLFSDKIQANAIHFLSSQNIEDVRYLIQSPLFGHFVMRNFSDPKLEGEHYGRLVKATLSERAFGLEALMKPGTKIQKIALKKSAQKQDAVEAVRNYLIAAKYQSRMATTIANAVDELLMNAIFDAPVNELGKQLYASATRTTQIDLVDKHSVEMQVAFDGTYVGITAIDIFGSLDKVKLLTYISKIYTQEEYKVRSTVAGAGIGLATVFRSGGSFFFVSESGTRTEVTVFFRRTDNFREFKDQFRFLSTQFYL